MGVNKDIFWVWNRVRNWTTGRHTPTKNSQEYPSGFALYKDIQNSLGFWIPPRRGFRNSGTGFWILSLWNLDSGFQTLAGFRIPRPGIPDTTSKTFSDSGIRITLDGAISCFLTLYFAIPLTSCSSLPSAVAVILVVHRSCSAHVFPAQGCHLNHRPTIRI